MVSTRKSHPPATRIDRRVVISLFCFLRQVVAYVLTRRQSAQASFIVPLSELFVSLDPALSALGMLWFELRAKPPVALYVWQIHKMYGGSPFVIDILA